MNPRLSILLHRDFGHLKQDITSALRPDFGRVSVVLGDTAGEDSLITISEGKPEPIAGRKMSSPRAAHATATRIVSTIINEHPVRPS